MMCVAPLADLCSARVLYSLCDCRVSNLTLTVHGGLVTIPSSLCTVCGMWMAWLGTCALWGEVRGRAAIDVRGRERSRVLCFYGVSDVAACWNPRGMVPVR